MEVVGICGSDVHYLVNGKIGPFVVKKPMVIGHEASGTVVQVGKKVKNLVPGDRVAIEPGVPCRMCDYCKTGRYHLCRDIYFCATPPDDGNLSRFYVHAADFCHKLPCNLSLEDGVLLEPLSCAVHGCKRANVCTGDVCLILGAGPIGLATMLAAKAMGASKVLVTDIIDVKLAMAKQLGAEFTIKTQKDTCDDDLQKEIIELLKGEPNISFDCSGADQAVRVALNVTKTGGVVVLIGLGQDVMELPLTSAVCREVDIRGIFRYVNDYPTALEMVRSGRVNPRPLITHHFTLEDTLKAFNTAKTQEGNPIKILIHTNPDWKPSTTSC